MYKPKFYKTFLLLIEMVIISVILLSNKITATDNIPRTSVLTDIELINCFDLTIPELKTVYEYYINGDIKNSLTELVKYIRNRNKPYYFFESKNINNLVEDYLKYYPENKNDIISSADEFINTYGSDVDWQVPGKDKLGRDHNSNTIRNLARQSKAVDIALSYYIKNHDVHYQQFMMSHVKDFLKDFQDGRTETGANDVFERYYSGHRTRNWLLMHQLFLNSIDYKDEDVILMLKVFFLQGAKLVDVCKDFHWGNHQLHGLAGLYEMSSMFPESPIMKEWNKIAADVIVEHISKEIEPDGFQFERASHYFKLDILNYFRIYQIAKLNYKPLPELYVQRFKKMFDAIVDLAKPDKSLPILQDAQDDYKKIEAQNIDSQKIESNNVAELSEPKESLFMSLGAVLFNNPVYKYFAGENLPEELYWFLNEDSYDKYKKLQIEKPSDKSVSLVESGYYVMRSGREINDLYLIIDGGLAKNKPDHTHGGALGIIAFGYGEELLKNYRVKYSNPSYKYLKNSLAKNVALADNYLLGQNWIDNNARTGFGIWKNLPQPKVSNWFAGNSFDYFSAAHNAFDTLNVEYERSILFVKPYFWIVNDEFESTTLHNYQQLWQADAEINRNKNYATYKGINGGIHIIQSDNSDMNITKIKKHETNAVQFEKNSVFNYSFSTVLFPFDSKDIELPEVKKFERENFKIIKVSKNNYRSIVYLKKGDNLKLDEIQTDADMTAVFFEDNIVKSIFLLNGSYLKTVYINLSSPHKVKCELTKNSEDGWVVNSLNKDEISIMQSLIKGKYK